MKAILLSFPMISLMIISSSCVNSQNTDNHPGTGAKTRDITEFTGISVNIPADISISQDNNYSIQIDAKQETLDQIITEKKGSELVIKFKNNKWHSGGNDQIHIVIHLPKLNSLEINGSGNIEAETDFSTDKLNLEVNGSGDLKLMNISATSLNAQVNGSGSITRISGTTNSADIEINGSGDINGENLKGNSVTASIAGSGNITIGVSEQLDADIAGSGNIYYKGNPSSIKKEVIGSGSVSQR